MSVSWFLRSGTALAGSDFTDVSGTVTFGQGQTNATILLPGPGIGGIPIFNDQQVEIDEYFTVTLTNATGGASLPGGPVANANQSTATTNPVNPLTGARLSANNPPAQVAYRGCVNCHSQVHGSNHPAGIYLLR